MTLAPRAAAPFLLVAGLLSACGSSSSGSGSGATSAPTAKPVDASGGALTVGAKEYAFMPGAINAKAGKLKVTLDNAGHIPHEFVLLKTDAAPGSLKVKGGRVDEAASVGEVSETDAGAKKTVTFDLKPGKYVYVCNIPGHYPDGMRGQLTVR